MGNIEEFEKEFLPILDDNETIRNIYKPNKTKFWVSNMVYMTFGMLFFVMFLEICFLSGYFDGSLTTTDLLYINIGVLALVVFLYVLDIVYSIFFYKNLYFAVTNQRVIIRKGVFGTDFQALDMKMIGAINVSVTLLDKICHKNTGSIHFGSTSSPISNTSRNTLYNFTNITDPYKEYKEIKKYIDEIKSIDNK